MDCTQKYYCYFKEKFLRVYMLQSELGLPLFFSRNIIFSGEINQQTNCGYSDLDISQIFLEINELISSLQGNHLQVFLANTKIQVYKYNIDFEFLYLML